MSSTNLTSRERERFAKRAREVALTFVDLADGLDSDDAAATAVSGLLASMASPPFLQELRESLLDSLTSPDREGGDV